MTTSGAPLGSPWGLGAPVDAPDPPIGKPSLSRYISPGDGDISVDEDTGHLRAMPSIRQRFLLLARTVRGSSAVLPEFGIVLPDKMDDFFETRVENGVRNGARQMTDVEKVARIDAVLVERTSSGRATITISYTDLTTGVNDTVEAPI